MFNLKKTRGETIIEILLTSIILMITIISGFKVLSSVFTTKKYTEDRIIAVNLAREWLEAIRYIRDYNWLFYWGDAEVCWNHYEDFNNDGKSDWDENDNSTIWEILDWCDVNNLKPIAWGIWNEQEYILKQREWGTHWFLTRNVWWSLIALDSASSDVNCEDKDLDLGFDDCWDTLSTEWYWATSPTASYFQLCKWANWTVKEGFSISCHDWDADTSKPTEYYRYIKMSYDDVSTMRAIVWVKWIAGESTQDVELTTILTNFK